ncbi:reverse transcriptase family protein [Stutzerimonas kunmingensis]|uniref:reverse transcriptase family protein n=1 Tax=Stutzerimonas kunmingensis TaxID=1211807 RepID=UPI0028AA76F8|nr:reverse transcriptase family protein [Stutzerimonas kunmingensis]
MDEFSPHAKPNIAPIQSIANLCNALSLTREEFDYASSLATPNGYIPIELTKKDGSTRTVFDPHPALRRVQRRIKNRILATNVVYPKFLYGSLSDPDHPRDYVRCAAIHCGAKTIAKIDISNFFDNIDYDLTFRVFADILHYPREVSLALANICTREGTIPQGAATSSFIANLCLFEEGGLVEGFTRENLRYTRLVDDITLSSTSTQKNLTRHFSKLEKMLQDAGFTLNVDKSGIEHISTKAFSLHGLRISQASPQLPREEIRKIRADVHNLKQEAAKANARVSFNYRRLFESVSGKVNKLKRLEHPRYQTLRAQLTDIRPLPSKRDIRRCQVMLATLKRDFPDHSESYLYKKRYFRLRHRVGILRRIYEREAQKITQELKDLKPRHVDEH